MGIVKKMLFCGARSFPKEKEDVREGYIRVYVGKGAGVKRKLEVEANYLNHPLFANLLRLSEEEFGFSYDGALKIACEIDLFQHIIQLLESSNPAAHYMDISDLVSKFPSSTSDNARTK